MLKYLLFLFVILPFHHVMAQPQKFLNNSPSFDITVEILDIGHYTGCGVLVYTVCFKAKVIKAETYKILGDSVYLYVKCPESLNGLKHATDNIYQVNVTSSEPIYGLGLLHDCDDHKKKSYGSFKELYVNQIYPTRQSSLINIFIMKMNKST